ncbi:MAG: DUF6265 family protein [Xanthomonadales bacterium]|nr:DUF6265 family protein [Xanthomonadales bacterium]
MNRSRTLAGLGLAMCCFGASAGDLDWMLGCWETPDGSAREVWVRQSPGQLVGMAAVASEGRVVFHEVLVVEVDGGGAHYTAHVQGQDATKFTAKTFNDGEAAFVNAAHDFPQKVHYRRDGDRLLASISLLDGGDQQSFDKQRCR